MNLDLIYNQQGLVESWKFVWRSLVERCIEFLHHVRRCNLKARGLVKKEVSDIVAVCRILNLSYGSDILMFSISYYFKNRLLSNWHYILAFIYAKLCLSTLYVLTNLIPPTALRVGIMIALFKRRELFCSVFVHITLHGAAVGHHGARLSSSPWLEFRHI